MTLRSSASFLSCVSLVAGVACGGGGPSGSLSQLPPPGGGDGPPPAPASSASDGMPSPSPSGAGNGTDQAPTSPPPPAPMDPSAGPPPVDQPQGGMPAGPDMPPGAGMPPPDATFRVGPHPTLPQLPNVGGPVLKSPQLVLITYVDDANRTTLEAHAHWMMSSEWLATVGAEYGVGKGTVLKLVELPNQAPTRIDDAEIKAMLASDIQNGTLPRPADGTFADVVYMILFPAGSTVTQAGAASCEAFDGYHDEASQDGLDFAYSVVANCARAGGGGPITPLQEEEETITHELIEAATDPFAELRPGFAYPPTSKSPWLFTDGEVADLCENFAPAEYYDGQFVAQRIWSNAAAKRGDQDPCIPANPAEPFYMVGIEQPETTTIAAGTSTTFRLQAWSTASIPAWSVTVVSDPNNSYTPTSNISRTTMGNGDSGELTVGIPAGTPAGQPAVLWIESHRSDTEFQRWPVVVISG